MSSTSRRASARRRRPPVYPSWMPEAERRGVAMNHPGRSTWAKACTGPGRTTRTSLRIRSAGPGHTRATQGGRNRTGGRSVATQCQFSGDDNGGPHGLQAGGQVAPIVTPAATADQGRYRIPSPPRRRASHLVQIARRDPFRPSQVNRRPTTDAGSHPRPLRCHPAPFTGRPLARPTLVPQLAVPSGVQRSPTVEL